MIYRPHSLGLFFFEEFTEIMQDPAMAKGDLLIVGDLNVHLDVPENPETRRLMAIIESLGLVQHAVGPTHNHVHTLNVALSHDSDDTLKDVKVLDRISDHSLIACYLDYSKPKPVKQTITSRKLRSINIQDLQEDIRTSELTICLTSNVCTLVERYNQILTELLDKYVPATTKTVVLRSWQPWFTDSLHQAKRDHRKAEHKWLRSGSFIDFEEFKRVRNSYNNQLYKTKSDYFNNKILDCGNDSKNLCLIINDILHNKKTSKLPDCKCSQQLAEDFSLFFMCKIQKISDSFPVIPSTEKNQAFVAATCHWDAFTLATESDILQIISKAPSPTCLLDPMPTSMIKQLLDPLLPTITLIVNTFLSSGVVPDSFKSAVITSLLKKPGLDPNVLKKNKQTKKNTIGQLSNLSYLSKVLERVVAKQLTDHTSQNNLHESRQATYKHFLSPETTFLKVHNNIMWTMEKKGITILVLLDLSAAFELSITMSCSHAWNFCLEFAVCHLNGLNSTLLQGLKEFTLMEVFLPIKISVLVSHKDHVLLHNCFLFTCFP